MNQPFSSLHTQQPEASFALLPKEDNLADRGILIYLISCANFVTASVNKIEREISFSPGLACSRLKGQKQCSFVCSLMQNGRGRRHLLFWVRWVSDDLVSLCKTSPPLYLHRQHCGRRTPNSGAYKNTKKHPGDENWLFYLRQEGSHHHPLNFPFC